MTKKILLVFGTRPEAIKMAPLVKALQAQPAFEAYGDGFACERIAQTLLADKQLFAHAAGQPCRPASSLAVQP